MNTTRRRFCLHMSVIGAMCCSKSILANNLLDNAGAFEPTGQIEWLGDRFLWVGALKKDNKIIYSLIHQKPLRHSEILAEVGGPSLCRLGAAPYLYAATPSGRETIKVSGPNVGVRLQVDNGLSLENCKFSVAREVDRLERLGYGRFTALAKGKDLDASTNQAEREVMLACRPTASTESSELLLFEGGGAPRVITVNWPLALDNPVIVADVHSSDWLVYPSLTFDRRQKLKSSLPGIPVCRVTRDLVLSLTWVPWDDWNESGPYRFHILGDGLVAASSHGWTDTGEKLSGIYLLIDNRWQRRFSGQVDITSLASSGDQKYLAWSEQIKSEPASMSYSKLRHVVRVNSV